MAAPRILRTLHENRGVSLTTFVIDNRHRKGGEAHCRRADVDQDLKADPNSYRWCVESTHQENFLIYPDYEESHPP